MWRLPGLAFNAAPMAVLLLSVAHDVKERSFATLRMTNWGRADQFGHLLPRRLDHSFELGAEFVGTRRIAPLRGEVGHHGFQHLRQNGGGGVMVEVDHHLILATASGKCKVQATLPGEKAIAHSWAPRTDRSPGMGGMSVREIFFLTTVLGFRIIL